MRQEFESYNRLVPPSDVGGLLRYARDPKGEKINTLQANPHPVGCGFAEEGRMPGALLTTRAVAP